jgi:glucose-6-phosphate 1-dehydrogenase
MELLHYVDGDYADPDTFKRLRQALGPAQHPIHYLAIPPSLFGAVVSQLGRVGLRHERVVIEKPFGRNLASAQGERTLHAVFPGVDLPSTASPAERCPASSTSGLPTRSWSRCRNRNYVESVQITMAENFGVQGQGRFLRRAETIRDVVQNHLLQVVACVAMEPPLLHMPEGVRDETVKVLRSIQPLGQRIVRGQFTGYRAEAA